MKNYVDNYFDCFHIPFFPLLLYLNDLFFIQHYLYLESVSKEGKDLLSFKELKDLIYVKELEALTKEKESSYTSRNTVSLWFIENDFDGMEFHDKNEMRFRTRGEKCYLGMFPENICTVFICSHSCNHLLYIVYDWSCSIPSTTNNFALIRYK